LLRAPSHWGYTHPCLAHGDSQCGMHCRPGPDAQGRAGPPGGEAHSKDRAPCGQGYIGAQGGDDLECSGVLVVQQGGGLRLGSTTPGGNGAADCGFPVHDGQKRNTVQALCRRLPEAGRRHLERQRAGFAQPPKTLPACCAGGRVVASQAQNGRGAADPNTTHHHAHAHPSTPAAPPTQTSP
jgi:hypothetical protein